MDFEEELLELRENENFRLNANGSFDYRCVPEQDDTIVYVWLWWITGLLTSATAVLGIIANTLSLVVLSRRSMRSVFNHLLICLCVADLVFLLTNLLAAPLAMSSSDALIAVLAVIHPVTECFCHVALAASVFITIGITLERHQAVCSSHLYQSRLVATGHTVLLLYYIVPSVLGAIIFNIPRFIAFSDLGMELQNFNSYIKFIIAFQVLHPLTTTGLLPFLVLSILNYKIYCRMTLTVNRTRRTVDFLKAKIMMIIVTVFLLLNLPRLLIGLFEVSQIGKVLDCFDSVGTYKAPILQDIMDIVARYLTILNSSLNFLIYCMVGSGFRNALFSLFHCKSKPSSQSPGQSMGREELTEMESDMDFGSE